jgi:hypothetical protein
MKREVFSDRRREGVALCVVVWFDVCCRCRSFLSMRVRVVWLVGQHMYRQSVAQLQRRVPHCSPLNTVVEEACRMIVLSLRASHDTAPRRTGTHSGSGYSCWCLDGVLLGTLDNRKGGGVRSSTESDEEPRIACSPSRCQNDHHRCHRSSLDSGLRRRVLDTGRPA